MKRLEIKWLGRENPKEVSVTLKDGSEKIIQRTEIQSMEFEGYGVKAIILK